MERSQNATKVLIGALVLLVAVVAVVLIARSGGDDGSSTGSISTDITEVKEAVANVAARERVLSTVIGASPDVITILASLYFILGDIDK